MLEMGTRNTKNVSVTPEKTMESDTRIGQMCNRPRNGMKNVCKRICQWDHIYDK